MSLELLTSHHEIWTKKPLLRRLYEDWYELIASYFAEGKILEIGGGSGNFKEKFPHIISGDIVATPWTDVVMDAHQIPFEDNALGNLILFDVLHHLENPVLFFKEAIRVLRTGGRVIMLEPYISLVSYPVYRWLHPEPVVLKVDPFTVKAPDPNRQPFDSNQAIPTLFFEKFRCRFEKEFPQLAIIEKKYLAFFIYPLSGGFEKPSLIPLWIYPFFKWIEKRLKPFSRWIAFRILVILEKK